MEIAPGMSGVADRPIIDAFVLREHARGIAAVDGAQNTDRFGNIPVDGARRDTEVGGDLLGLAECGDAAEHIAVAIG